MKTELVTTLKRRATEIIADLRSDGDPILITQHGKPAAYLVDVASYDELNRRLSVVEGIALGEQAVRERRLHTQMEAKRRLSKWLK
jgi:prevent-host-death family protein